MERRLEPRFPAQISVQYCAVGQTTAKQTGQLRDVSEGGGRLSTPVPLAVGTFVQLELDDAVLYGEVRYCCPWLGGYVSGVLIERVLLGQSELSRLVGIALSAVPRAVHSPVP